jgi:Lipocalin-like domain
MRAGAARLGCRARRAIYPTRIIRHVRRGASNATRTSTTTNPTKIPATKGEQVNLSRLLMIAAITLVGSDYAVAQSLKDQLAGTWLLVSNVNVAPDGTKRQPFGDSPKGVLILQSDGHYAAMFIRPGRPKFKANNRLQGTPEELKAAWDGALAHFGTWSVVEADTARRGLPLPKSGRQRGQASCQQPDAG